MMKRTALITYAALVLLIRPSITGAQTDEVGRAAELLASGKPDSAAVLLYRAVDTTTDESDRVKALYYLAKAMDNLGRFDEEIRYLIMARELSSEAAFADDVRYEYAQILLKTGNIEGCLAVTSEFTELYGLSPLMPNVLYIIGEARFRSGRFRLSFNSFNTVRERYPDSPAAGEAVAMEGLCLYRLDLITGAIERFEEYLRLSPKGENVETVVYHLGLSYERSDRLKMAAGMFERLTHEYPSFPGMIDIYYRLGEMYYRSGDYVAAENTFENYIFNTPESNNRHQEALYYLERIKFQMGQYGSETDIAENFVTKYPESPRTPKALFDLARYYRAIKNIPAAVEKYKILMNNPLYVTYTDSALYSAVETFTEAGRFDDARTFLKNEIVSSPEKKRAGKLYFKLGLMAESLESYDEAIAWYDSALVSSTQSNDIRFSAFMGVGRSFRELNRWYEAADTFNHIINELPPHPEKVTAYRALADVYFLQGRIRESIAMAEQSAALSRGRDKTETLLFLAKLYEEIDENHALQLYTIVFKDARAPLDFRSQALLAFGELSLRRGDRPAARTAFAKVVDSGADSVAVKRAQNHLNQIGTAPYPQRRQPLRNQ